MGTSHTRASIASIAALAVILSAAPHASAAPAGASPSASQDAAPWNTVWTPPETTDDAPAGEPGAPTSGWVAPTDEPRAAGQKPRQQDRSSTIQKAPAGTAAGAPGLGALPWFGFDETEISLDIVARVNVANGNLLLTASDSLMNGVGPALRSDRFYNGLSTATGSFGGGWSSSLSHADSGLQVSGTTATYRGSNGFSVKFTKSGSTWSPQAGFNATLTEDGTSSPLVYS